MNVIVFLNIISLIFLGWAGLLLLANRKAVKLSTNELLPLVVCIGLYVFVCFSNVLEHSGITAVFDYGEDIAEMIFPLLCLFFIDSWRNQRSLEALRARELSLQSALQKLSNEEKKYRQLVENANDAIFIVQGDRLAFYNQRTLDLLQYTAEEVDATPFLEFVHPDDRKEVMRNFSNRIQNEGNPPPTYTIKVVAKDNTILTAQLNAVLVEWKNQPAILNFARDMTEQIKLEQNLYQAQKLESIGTLAGGVAHDFNNILSAIMGYTEIARSRLSSDNEAVDDLDRVLAASSRAKDLVQQILAFSRKSEIDRVPVQIHFVVLEALKLLRSSIPSTIEIRHNIDTDSGLVFADATQVHQIVMNLCTNAFHAMDDSGGVLAVSLKCRKLDGGDFTSNGQQAIKPGEYLELTVSDTGPGIEKRFLDKIFDPYFTTKEKGKGTGLGLSVVHGIVKSYGGHISVYCEEGKGTTFRVYLPKIVADRYSEQQLSHGVTPRGYEKCLVVDDEEDIANLEKIMLESLGYTVTATNSSDKALEVFKKDPTYFDLVITDMTMPQFNGTELTQKLREIRPDIPVILFSGFSELIDGERAKALGMQKYLMKPVTKHDLATAVRQVLDA